MIKDILISIREKEELKNLKTDSKIVKGWAKEFDVPSKYLVILWKKAICIFLQDGKRGCKPRDNDWPVIVNIFKTEVKKYLSKVDNDIKFRVKNPTIKGQKVRIHYNEARKISLEEIIKEYKKELKACCSKCSSICKD